MKATGVVRNLDSVGRVVVPMELRRTMDIQEGDPVEFFTDDGQIILRKYQPGCQFCGGMEDLVTVGKVKGGVTLCRGCGEKIAGEVERVNNGKI